MKRIYLNTLTPEEIISRLKKGEVVKNEESDATIRFIDGVLFRQRGSETEYSIVNPIITIGQCDYYFEEEEKFEVDSTGLYLTKNRLKAFVSRIDDDKAQGIIEGGFSKSYWDKTGAYMNNKIPDYDLISKWEE